jgi:deferrochelatase/peroxidase EfeB
MAGPDLDSAVPDAPLREAADIQGLLKTGYGSLPDAAFLLLRVADAAAARAWIGHAPVTSVAMLQQRVPSALQLAFTAEGLRALGLAEETLTGFSAEFLSGMAGDAARSRRLGDTGDCAPAGWRWGGASALPHLLVMLYAEAGGLEALRRNCTAGEDWRRGFTLLRELGTGALTGREPFGFPDGVSQPEMDWEGRRRPGGDADLAYGNAIAAGEFVLGYSNEYGFRTERPLPAALQDPRGGLPASIEDPGRRDLGRNGTYLVFRQLHQDVRGFWRFLAAQVPDPVGRLRLAEAMVGRSIGGDPLVPALDRPIAGVGPGAEDSAKNGFTYAADPEGLQCPIGAHIRRANPRTGDMPGQGGLLTRLIRILGLRRAAPRDDVIAASRFHRLLRRGRTYGPGLTPEQALQADAGGVGGDAESGLHFICLVANIARQFEFVQDAWLHSAKFDGLRNERDPLVGNREPLFPDAATDGFSLQQEGGACRHVTGLPRFVTPRGGAYFFMPGLRGLRHIAAGPGTARL